MEYKPRQQRTSPLLWIICAAMLAALGFWAGWMIQERQRWTNFLEMLKAEPGIVLATVERKDGKYVIAGLLDPLATEPHRLLQEAHLDSSKVISRWEPYHAIYPAFILHRANTLLAPPDTVHLSLDNGVLRAIGSAPHAWIVEAERLSRLIPGVVEFHHDLLVDTALAELAVLKQRIEQDRLHFRINALQLAPGQEDTFQRLSASMHRLHDLAQSAHAHVSIQIRGHTDTTGGEGKNQQLSQERADRILSTLAAEGLARASMSAVGVSTKEPLVDEVTEEDRALNRRVSFRVNLTGIAKP